MNLRQIVSAGVFSLLAGIAAHPPTIHAQEASAATVDAAALRVRGLEAHRVGDHARALQLFRAAANRGDAPSARLAIFMLNHCADLYRRAFDCDPAEAAGLQTIIDLDGASTAPLAFDP